jgi:hypothetical protein
MDVRWGELLSGQIGGALEQPGRHGAVPVFSRERGSSPRPPLPAVPLGPQTPPPLARSPSTPQGMTFAACWWRLWLLASFTWIMAFTFAAFSFGDYLF